MIPKEERVRRRAHQLWIEQGYPSGREIDHWTQAEREINAAYSEDGNLRPLEENGKLTPEAAKEKLALINALMRGNSVEVRLLSEQTQVLRTLRDQLMETGLVRQRETSRLKRDG